MRTSVFIWPLLAVVAVFLALGSLAKQPKPVQASVKQPASTGRDTDKGVNMEKAIFAAGCFWGVEAAFRELEGVTATRVGYTGGRVPRPTYQEVCSDTTGHAEAVEVTFDPSVHSYKDLLEVFWEVHDPTQVNRQGPDVGSQYRSAVFYLTEQQKIAAEESKAALNASGAFKRPIATEITKASEFWEAEDYHQQYLEKRGLASCHIRK